MTTSQPSLLTRHDTFFGVCEGLGQDFGINSNYFRFALGVGLLLSPVAALATYFGLGLVLAISRWIFPARSKAVAVQDAAPPATLAAHNDEGRIDIAQAA